MVSRFIVFATGLVIAGSVPSSGFAQSSAAPATPRIADRIARNHFENGNQYFRLGRYADAAREFEHAHEITHQPELLYNIGWSYELGGDLRAAMTAYEQFEAAGAPGFGLDPLHERMANLRLRMANEAPSPAPSSSAPPASEAPANTPPVAVIAPPVAQPEYAYRRSTLDTIGPFVAIGVGVVFGGLAAWQGVSYASDAGAFTAVNAGSTPWSTDLQSRYDRVGTEGALTWVFGGVGVAFIATGAVWLALRGPGERYEVRRARGIWQPSFGASVSGASIGLQGSF